MRHDGSVPSADQIISKRGQTGGEGETPLPSTNRRAELTLSGLQLRVNHSSGKVCDIMIISSADAKRDEEVIVST